MLRFMGSQRVRHHGYHPQITRLGLPDEFVEHGTVKELQHIVGIDKEAILSAINK